MANTPTALVRTSLTDSNATLYTASGTVVITSIALCNINSSARTVTLSLDGVKLFDEVSLGGDTTVIAEIKQVLTNGLLIEGSASVTTDVKIHISGMVIS